MKTVLFAIAALVSVPNAMAGVDQILSMQQAEGNFSVICTDLKRESSTAQKIKEDQVCLAPQPTVIMQGLYDDPSGQYCGQYLTPGPANTLRIDYKDSCSGNYAELTCDAGTCEGQFNGESSGSYHVRMAIHGDKIYDYYGVDNGGMKTFHWISAATPASRTANKTGRGDKR